MSQPCVLSICQEDKRKKIYAKFMRGGFIFVPFSQLVEIHFTFRYIIWLNFFEGEIEVNQNCRARSFLLNHDNLYMLPIWNHLTCPPLLLTFWLLQTTLQIFCLQNSQQTPKAWVYQINFTFLISLGAGKSYHMAFCSHFSF